MPRPAPHDGVDKFRRYRSARREAGMKLVRIWAPDPHALNIAAAARREAALLRGARDEQEALDFIEALEADIDE